MDNKKTSIIYIKKLAMYATSLFTFFLICSFFPSAHSSGIFNQENYFLPHGQSMIICPCGKKHSEFSWKLDNINVLNINEKGVITGINQGNCLIEAKEKKTGKISKCKITITPPEEIIYTYTSPNQVYSHRDFSVCSITSSTVEKVKFVLHGKGKIKEVNAQKIKNLGDKYLWSAKLVISDEEIYEIQTYAFYAGKWANNKSLNMILSPFNGNSPESSLLIARKASENIIKFISSCEGFSRNLIPDCKNKFSIGYGHIVLPFKPFYKNISKEEGLSLLMNDINNSYYSKVLNKFLIENNIYSSQNQFDALLSFTYNLGIGWITEGSKLKNLILSISNAQNGSNKKFWGKVISKNGLNLRVNPSVNSKKIYVLHFGEEFEILSTNKYNNSWYLVKVSNGTTGYCNGNFIKLFQKDCAKKHLKNINRESFIKLFCAYHHAGGKCSTSLLSRRFHELDIFFGKPQTSFNYLYYKKSPYARPECMKFLK